jgi:GNAT superfamily N-acetyltransferase
MTIQVRPASRDDLSTAEAIHAIESAAVALDVPDYPRPTLRATAARIRRDWPGKTVHRFLAGTDSASPGRSTSIGTVAVVLPQLDNTTMAEIELTVHPAHRRRGVGRALYETATAFARAQGRQLVQAELVVGLPGGPPRDPGHAAFAEAMGAKMGLAEVRRRLDLDTVDRASWDRAADEARPYAEGYTVVRWTDTAPEDIVADVARLDSRLNVDAPTGDLVIEAEKIDVTRVRQTEHELRLRGRRPYHAGFRHDATGQLVAWTAVSFDVDTPDHAWQQITIVDPEHRGHRLGLLVKVENLRHVLEHQPAARFIDTFNAAENTYMISINEAVGFRAVDGWQVWQAGI